MIQPSADASETKGPAMITEADIKPPDQVSDPTSLMIESAPMSIKKARDFVTAWFAARGFESSAHTAQTTASELVTNAHRHGTEPGDRILVRVYVSDAGPVIEVWDGSPKLPVVHQLDGDSEDGRGLAMLSLMVKAWGFNALASGGKCVWAVIGHA